MAGVIPVYRSIDAVTGDHNVSAFATSHTLLRNGGMVAVFPEGISHDEVSLQPLKTGAARIALEAAAAAGAEDLVTVAVGLVYDAKARFRSCALVRVGQPVKVADWAEAYRRDERTTVARSPRIWRHSSSASIPRFRRGRKPGSSPGSPSWSCAVPARTSRASPRLADRVGVATGLAAHQAACPEALQQLLSDFATYERDLELLGVRDAQLVNGSPHHRWASVSCGPPSGSSPRCPSPSSGRWSTSFRSRS